jgi:hypothetical protein
MFLPDDPVPCSVSGFISEKRMVDSPSPRLRRDKEVGGVSP